MLLFGAAGCGHGQKKLTASQLEVVLHHGVDSAVHIKCVKGNNRWDYNCTFAGDGITGTRLENTYGYDVEAHHVTHQSG